MVGIAAKFVDLETMELFQFRKIFSAGWENSGPSATFARYLSGWAFAKTTTDLSRFDLASGQILHFLQYLLLVSAHLYLWW